MNERDSYLDTARFPAQLHLAELAFTDRITEYVLPKPGLFLAPRMIVPTPRSLPWFFTVRRGGYNRRRSSVVVVQVGNMVWLSQFLTLPLAFNVNLRGRHQYAV